LRRSGQHHQLKTIPRRHQKPVRRDKRRTGKEMGSLPWLLVHKGKMRKAFPQKDKVGGMADPDALQ